MYFLLAVFLISALVVGRGDGVRCVLCLGACGGICALTARLMTGAEASPVAAMGVCVVLCLVAVTFLLLSPMSHALIATLGAGAAVGVAVVVMVVFLWILKLTGGYNPTMRDLWYGSGTGQLRLHWIMLWGMILASVGITADLAIAVTSTMANVALLRPEARWRDLALSGMRFGGDVTGTEINTLIFALMGVNFGAVLLPLATPDVREVPIPWIEILNRQATAVEAVTALAGTLGLLLAIPVTALIGAALIRKRRAHASA